MSDSKDDIKDYDVGYKKPPKNTQFKKGQSGNKNGRPKGSKNLSTIFNSALNVSVRLNKQGKQLKVKKNELMITSLVNQGASGNLKAIEMILQYYRKLQGANDTSAPMLLLKPTDEKVQAAFLDRMRESIRSEIEHEQALQSKEIDTPTGETQ
jgi:hypothetical protein